ncbi:MAG: hypothetical protein JXA99_02305 [Candidatus Lokiarchaeota archaeon]|nr:hypothetical protein [Candidatus Lokiarchaeota archaeon]
MSSDNDKYLRPLVLDIGSNTFKMGWGGDDFPDIIAPSIYVDRTDYIFNSDVIDGLEEIFMSNEDDGYYYGNEALTYQNILKLHEFKKENNYNIFSKFFLYHYEKLKIPEDYRYLQPIILVSSFIMTDIDRNKYENIFFQEFKFPYILFINDDKAILSTLKKTDGIIINMGESKTYISSIYRGFTNIMARDIFPIAGKELTNFFLSIMLKGRGASKNIYLNYYLAKEIKEKMGICVMNPKAEREKIKEGLTKYNRMINLPDNSKFDINFERFQLVEPLFDPKLIHIDYISLPEAIAKVIKFWDRENWSDLLSDIIISGGNSLFPGIKERLTFELKKYFPEQLHSKIEIIAASGRENMSWIGASILYSQNKLQGWIKNPNLEEQPNLMNQE